MKNQSLVIKRLRASFGCLSGAELDLNSGINVVHLPNEGGKSTWLAFIMAMLYGIDTSERDSKTSIADKNRYRPWNGAAMEGSIELIWNGVPITISRGGGKGNMLDFSAVNTETGQSVEALTASNCGESLIGVPKSVFERSAFIHQGQLGVDTSSDLERRLQALVSTGEESYSFSDADTRLAQWLRRLKSGSTGVIAQLESEIAQINAQLEQLTGINREITELTGQSERLKEDAARLENELEAIERQNSHEIGKQIAEAKQELERETSEDIRIRKELAKFPARPDPDGLRAVLRAVEAYEQAEEQARISRAEAKPPEARYPDCFSGLTADEGWDMAQKDSAKCAEFLKQADKSLWILLLWLIPLIAGVTAAFFTPFLIPGLAVIGICVIGFVVCFLFMGRKKSDALDSAGEIMDKYGANEEIGILDAASEYRMYHTRMEDFRSRLEIQASELKLKHDAILSAARKYSPDSEDIPSAHAATLELLNLLTAQKECNYRLFTVQKLHGTLLKAAAGKNLSGQEMPVATMTLEEAEEALAAVRDKEKMTASAIAVRQGQAQAIGDSAELSSRLELLTQKLSRCSRQTEAISLARDQLSEAHMELQGRFSPKLNQRTGELMNLITSGRYEKVLLDKALNAETVQQGDILTRKHLYLSTGTMDQLYLAVRLALCEILLPEGAPLFLDDAFSSFDESRLKAAVELLRTEFSGRQIILFSCHDRESRLINDGDLKKSIDN